MRPDRKVWLVGMDDMRLRLPLAAALEARGWRTEVLGTVPEEAFADTGVPYHQYCMARSIAPRGDWAAWRQLCHLLATHRPDVVHAFDKKPAILAPFACGETGVGRAVTTVTGLGYLFSTRSPLALSLRPCFHVLQRLAAQRTHAMVFQNTQDREYFRAHGLVRSGCDRLIRSSGVALEDFQVSGEASARLRTELGLTGRTVVLMVSRILALKGVREFLAAAAAVRRHKPDVAFLLVGPVAGEGRHAVPLRELRAAAESVRYLGPRTDVPALLSICDMFVLPTYYREGVPRVLLEAAAVGRPLVTTGMPGCLDVVRHEWNGLLVPPRDAAALAQAILRLAGDPGLREALGRRAREHVADQFSLGRVADAYAETYDGLLADPRPVVASAA